MMIGGTSDTLRARLGQVVSQIREQPPRPLDVIRRVEAQAEEERGRAASARENADSIQSIASDWCRSGEPVQDEVIMVFELLQDLVKAACDTTFARVEGCRQHPDIRPHDGLEDAINAHLAALESLHEALGEARLALMSAQALANKPKGPGTVVASPDEIERTLLAL